MELKLDISFIDCFYRVCDTYPYKIALVDNERSITYSELKQEIEKCAFSLRKRGINKGDRVSVCMGNSIEFVIIVYSVMTVGGISVMLNASANSCDIGNWVEHSGSSWLFVESVKDEFVSMKKDIAQEIKLVSLNYNPSEEGCGNLHFIDFLKESSTEASRVSLSPDDVAVIIYTSGTTGDPKGVTLTHRNLSTNYESVIRYLQLSSDDSVVCVLPFYYSYGSSVLNTHLMVGATVILEKNFMYPSVTLQKIEKYAATGFSGVPSTFILLLKKTNLSDYDLSSLRYITQAGGALPVVYIEQLNKILGSTKIFIMYGQTEASARLTYLPPEKLTEKMGSVGLPVDGVSLQIRDEKGIKVKSGEKGEVYVSGDNIMPGYWRNKIATESTVVNGWLKTGDLGHLDKDGFLYLVGRKSEMIKVGGNRIAPGEIEEVLSELDGIREVAVVGISDELLGQVIKAVIVLNDETELNSMKIKSYCKSRLATYKIPKKIEFADSLPKTASGKIKRFKLV